MAVENLLWHYYSSYDRFYHQIPISRMKFPKISHFFVGDFYLQNLRLRQMQKKRKKKKRGAYLFSRDQTAIWKMKIEFIISDDFSWIWHNLLTRYSLLLTPCAVSGRNNECKRTRDSFNSHQRIQESAIITLLYGSRKQCCQLYFLVIKRPLTY